MRNHLRRAWLIGLTLLSLLIGLVGGMALDRQVLTASGQAADSLDLHLIAEAWDVIRSHYVDRTAFDEKQITYAAIGAWSTHWATPATPLS